MKRQPPKYKDTNELEDEIEAMGYICKIHQATASILFDRHFLVAALPYLLASKVFIRGEALWFVTSIGENGDTCHKIFVYEEALHYSLLDELEEKQYSWRIH